MDNKKSVEMLEILLANGYKKKDVEEFSRSMNEHKEEIYAMHNSNEGLRNRVKAILKELNANEDTIGYDYLTEALVHSYNNPNVFDEGILFSIYTPVAKKCYSVPSEVRDEMQKLIDVIWSNTDKQIKFKYFGRIHQNSETLTNSRFIEKLVNYLKAHE